MVRVGFAHGQQRCFLRTRQPVCLAQRVVHPLVAGLEVDPVVGELPFDNAFHGRRDYCNANSSMLANWQ